MADLPATEKRRLEALAIALARLSDSKCPFTDQAWLLLAKSIEEYVAKGILIRTEG